MDYLEIQSAIERELKTSPHLSGIAFYKMQVPMNEISTTPSKQVNEAMRDCKGGI